MHQPVTGASQVPAKLHRPIIGSPLGVSDWWAVGGASCVWAAYQPKGAADQASSYLDLSGNGNNAGVGVAPTWNATNGWIFNGSTQYLTTTFVPQTDSSQSMIIQFTNRASVTRYLAGMRDADDRRFALSGYLNTGRAYFNGTGHQIAGAVTAGNLCVAGVQGYLDGAADGAPFADAWGGAASSAVYIGGWNNGGVAELFCSVYIQALAIYDCTLTAAQVAAVASAMSVV